MANPKVKINITAVDKTKQAFASVNKSIGGVNKSVGILAASLASLAAFGAMGRMVKSTVELGDKLDKLSTRLGVSSKFLSEMRYASESAGVGFDTFTMALQRMERRLGELAATGKGEAKPALELLGIAIKDLETLTAEQQFKKLTEAISKVESPQKKLLIAMKLFDSEGVRLIQMMEDGALGLDEYAKKAGELGIVFDNVDTAKMAEAQQAMTNIGFAVEGLGNKLVQILLPAFVGIEDMLGGLGDGLAEMAEELRTTAEWAGAFSTGDIDFWEWVSTGNEEARSILDATALAAEDAINRMISGSTLAGGAYFELNQALAEGSNVAVALYNEYNVLSAKQEDLNERANNLNTAYQNLASQGTPAAVSAMAILRSEMVAVSEQSAATANSINLLDYAMRNMQFSKLQYEGGDVPTIDVVADPIRVAPARSAGGKGGGGGKSEAEKEAEALAKAYSKLYESLNPLVKLSREYAEDTNILNNALAAGLATTEQIALAQATLTEEYLKSKGEMAGLSDATSEWADIADSAMSDFASGFADTLVDGIMSGQMAFEDFAQSFLANIAKMIIEQAILNALTGNTSDVGGIIGAISNALFPSAKGNAFDSGNVIPFASGGIISGPTLFPLGIAGEAGPEAILPLQRDSSGKLGVASSGGGTSITIINNTDSKVSASEEQDSSGNTNVQFMIEGAMKEGFSSGRMDRTMMMFGGKRVPM